VTTEVTAEPDGRDIAGQIASQLAYLSRLARHLGVNDPVEEYFAPVVGRWSDMHDEAERWRLVGQGVEEVTGALNKPLGQLDAAWDGEAATSFIDYMQNVGLAGNDLADAMGAMADVLDQTANGLREIVVQLASVLAETANTASESMTLPVQGDARTREYLDLMRRPSKELFDAVRQILEAFAQLCDGVDGEDAFRAVTMAHTYPEENWTPPGLPSVPAPGGQPVDTSTESAGVGDLGGGGAGAGDFGGGAGGFGGGVGGGAAAASAGQPLSPGNLTMAGEQAPRGGSPAAAAAAAGGGTPKPGGGAGMPMAPMMGGMAAGGQGGDQNHKNRSRVVGNPTDIFGKPEKASTPVIGADD
jgi:uncharacterized protein YukE